MDKLAHLWFKLFICILNVNIVRKHLFSIGDRTVEMWTYGLTALTSLSLLLMKPRCFVCTSAIATGSIKLFLKNNVRLKHSNARMRIFAK